MTITSREEAEVVEAGEPKAVEVTLHFCPLD